MRRITSAVMVEHVVFSSETTAKNSCAFLYKYLSNSLINYWDQSLCPLSFMVGSSAFIVLIYWQIDAMTRVDIA